MVLKFSWPDRAAVEAAAEKGISEWETTIQQLSHLGGLELAEHVAMATSRPFNGTVLHAYSDAELGKLVRLLKLEASPDIKALRRCTDIFAIIMGISVRFAPRQSPTRRAESLTERVINPARRLQAALADFECLKDLAAAGAIPERIGTDNLRNLLREIEIKTKGHVRKLIGSKRKGKQWDSDLCKQHVYLAALLCEFINPDFEPSRDQRFRGITELLAKPLFPLTSKFVNAIRRHAKQWNDALRRAWANPETLRG